MPGLEIEGILPVNQSTWDDHQSIYRNTRSSKMKAQGQQKSVDKSSGVNDDMFYSQSLGNNSNIVSESTQSRDTKSNYLLLGREQF